MKLIIITSCNLLLLILISACQLQVTNNNSTTPIQRTASNLVGNAVASNNPNYIEFYNNDVVIHGQNMQCMAFKYGPHTLVTFAGCVYDSSRGKFSFEPLPNEAGLVMYINNPDSPITAAPIKFVSAVRNIVVHPSYIAKTQELKRLRKNQLLANYETPPLAFIFLEKDIPLITANKPVHHDEYESTVHNTPLLIAGTNCSNNGPKALNPQYVETKLSDTRLFQNNFLIEGASDETYRNLMVTAGHQFNKNPGADGCFGQGVCPVSLCTSDFGGAVYSHTGVAGIHIGYGISASPGATANQTFLNVHYSFGKYEVQQWMENTHYANAQRFGFPLW